MPPIPLSSINETQTGLARESEAECEAAPRWGGTWHLKKTAAFFATKLESSTAASCCSGTGFQSSWCFVCLAYYEWLAWPPSQQMIDDVRLLGLIRESLEASGLIFGVPRILCALREVGSAWGWTGLLRAWNAIRFLPGTATSSQVFVAPRRRWHPHITCSDSFREDPPDQDWVTDTIYVRTYKGWLRLAAVDLYSRNMIGWSMKRTVTKEIAPDVLMMARKTTSAQASHEGPLASRVTVQ